MKNLLMKEIIFLLFCLLWRTAFSKVPFYVPFYGTTVGGFKSAARGWNSWGMQDNYAGYRLINNQSSILSQCRFLRPFKGADTYCSIDSNWHLLNGDKYGRIIPDPKLYPNIIEAIRQLHARGIKFGVYIRPGGFTSDVNKTVMGTNIKIGSLFNFTEDPSKTYCNQVVGTAITMFDYTKNGVKQWHKSVIKLFASWGVDFIKMDIMTPGSPQGGCLPYDDSLSAKFYRDAIDEVGRPIRLDLSWKLNRSEPYWDLWRSTADSLRTDQDINNENKLTFVSWGVVQRAINQYRLFINEQVSNSSRHGHPIKIHPDMDNMYIGNAENISGITDQQRYTVAMHWIGAGANLITGSDMTQIDKLGKELLWNAEAMEIADFCSQFPMQPRNPEGTAQPGGNDPSQFQTWIAGPSASGEAVVIQTNYGPDLGGGRFNTSFTEPLSVNITMDDLGIGEGSEYGAKMWNVRTVWGAGKDHTGPWKLPGDGLLATVLGPGESVMYKLTRIPDKSQKFTMNRIISEIKSIFDKFFPRAITKFLKTH